MSSGPFSHDAAHLCFHGVSKPMQVTNLANFNCYQSYELLMNFTK